MLNKIKLRHIFYSVSAIYLCDLVYGYFASIGVDESASLALSAFMTLLFIGLTWTIAPSLHSQYKSNTHG